jgi:5-methyltetrahydrofolate--homocysteine methyltransferase
LREEHQRRLHARAAVSFDKARGNHFKCDWAAIDIPAPKLPGKKVFRDYPLAALREAIDWTPFFQTWELKGKYPEILKDAEVGEEAKKLLADANKMLDTIIKEKLLTANAVFGIYPANSVNGKDVELYTNEKRDGILEEFYFLRQQGEKSSGAPHLALSDFIAPKHTGLADHIGLFAVTAGVGLEQLVKRYEDEHDDYSAIMAKALADRLAEAFAEHLHCLVRIEYWGYGKDESFTNEELIAESYRGIRPAPGYPACPDHTEKLTLFKILDAEKETGIKLTESLAMHPAASVCGYYFAHPGAKYFTIGKIQKDQILDYHKRKGLSIQETEKWLAPILGYDGS